MISGAGAYTLFLLLLFLLVCFFCLFACFDFISFVFYFLINLRLHQPQFKGRKTTLLPTINLYTGSSNFARHLRSTNKKKIISWENGIMRYNRAKWKRMCLKMLL